MPPDLPSTVAAPVSVELEIKRSRFLAHLSPAADLSAAETVIARCRKEHWEARHHCTAMILGTHADQQRSSDDGEPAGTAGSPMLDVLRHRALTDVVVVVTRYFGGVLLGAGGLVRAYSGAVSQACDAATVLRRERVRELVVDVPHAEAGRVGAFVHSWAAQHRAVALDPEYGASARLGALVRLDDVGTFEADLAALTLGAVTALHGEVRVVSVP
ncbi:putative YigZ family protein [Sediminihabitans luteus]|uniref:Putative YigZ family protein n=1 Tax=Sediminihabitans luteus TaxID=1138585 RepID=A0A2M9CR14_9CELL|nr:YigZ family protein [Sediminihabitans luteus]PJJ74275.1 putative YigZ family protein [Sediminihabitans luteus]GII99128.1 YigZ family protein [Sediminihabitans luteus]